MTCSLTLQGMGGVGLLRALGNQLLEMVPRLNTGSVYLNLKHSNSSLKQWGKIWGNVLIWTKHIGVEGKARLCKVGLLRPEQLVRLQASSGPPAMNG